MPLPNTPIDPAPLTPYHSPAGLKGAGPFAFNAYPGGTLPAAAASPTFSGLLHALKRRWVLATFLGLFVAVSAATVTLLSMPSGKHLARAVLLMPMPSGGTTDSHRVFKEHQFQTLRSRNVVNLLINKIGDPARLTMLQEVDDKHRFIEESIDVRWIGDDTLRVSMTGDNADELKLILDQLLKALIEYSDSNENTRRTVRVNTLKSLTDKLSTHIESLRKELKANAVGVSGVVPSDNGNQMQLQTYQKIEADMQERMNAMEVRLATCALQSRQTEQSLSAKAPRVPVEITERLVAQDPRVRRAEGDLFLKQETFQKAKPLAETNKYYIDAKKAVADAEKELADTKLRVLPEVEAAAQKEYRNSLLQAQNDTLAAIDQTKNEMEAARNRLVVISGNIQTMMARVVENQIIQDKIKPLNEHLTKVRAEKLELESLPAGEEKIKVFDDATVYPNQNLKQRAIAGAVAALAGLGGVLFLIAFLEWRSRRIDSVEQVMTDLGMRVIGTIPAFPSKASIKAGSVDANQSWRFILNESVNSARTLLLHTAKAQSMQVIMVTSAMQGEGKTSLASQLATSMATAGLRTLILDCDMRNPSVHRLFDVALTPGCSEILCQEVDVADAVQPTSVPNLWMIAGGKCSNRVVAALAQGHPLEALFDRLRGQFDFVVVDSCPVLPVADALLIGQHVDGVVFSILQDISQLPKVLDASKRLTSLNIPLLGAVVNGTRVDAYAYGYNYVKQLPA